jgi:hypothetical protein
MKPEDRPRPKATQQELDAARAALLLTRAVADTIQELGQVPSGHLYAQLLDRVSLETYTRIIALLKRADLVTEDGFHMLTWKGPKLVPKS